MKKLKLILLFCLFPAIRCFAEEDEEGIEHLIESAFNESPDAHFDDGEVVNPSELVDKAASILKNILSKEENVQELSMYPFFMMRSFGNHRNKNQKFDDSRVSKSFLDLSDSEASLSKLNGPHVCVKESIEASEGSGMAEEEGEKHADCRRHVDAVVCTSKSQKGRIVRRVQDCCQGFTTDDIYRKGCNREIDEEKIAKIREQIDATISTPTVLVGRNDTMFVTQPHTGRSFEWHDKQVISGVGNEQRFVARVLPGFLTNVRLNCATKQSSFRVNDTDYVMFDGPLRPAGKSLLDLIEGDGRLSKFLKVIGDDIREFLRESESSTVFAFTDDAFDSLPDATKQLILHGNGDECVQELIKKHITTSGSFCLSDIPFEMRTLDGNTLTTSRTTKRVKIEEATIVDGDAYALNGVLHVIDSVLLRENYLSWRDTLRIYNKDLAEKLEELSIKTPLTIFVPPIDNTTMMETPSNLVISNQLLTNLNEASKITTDANSTIFVASKRDALPSNSLSMRIGTGELGLRARGMRIGCSHVNQLPIRSCKAVFHFVDEPLPLVTQSIEELLDSREDLSRFYKLWTMSEVSKHADSLLTVFAPTNDAFSNNVFKKISKTTKAADEFVKRHVVKATLCQRDLEKKKFEVRFTTFSSIGGDLLTPRQRQAEDDEDDGGIEINGVRIIESQHVQSNGIVYVLESHIPKAPVVAHSASNHRRVEPFNIFSHLFG